MFCNLPVSHPHKTYTQIVAHDLNLSGLKSYHSSMGFKMTIVFHKCTWYLHFGRVICWIVVLTKIGSGWCNFRHLNSKFCFISTRSFTNWMPKSANLHFRCTSFKFLLWRLFNKLSYGHGQKLNYLQFCFLIFSYLSLSVFST